MNLVERLKKYYDCEMNVLLTGEHGVGKTSIVKQAFEEKGLVLNESWLYFSGSTLDPWVDFIGIPKEVEYNGKKCIAYLEPFCIRNSIPTQPAGIFISPPPKKKSRKIKKSPEKKWKLNAIR